MPWPRLRRRNVRSGSLAAAAIVLVVGLLGLWVAGELAASAGLLKKG